MLVIYLMLGAKVGVSSVTVKIGWFLSINGRDISYLVNNGKSIKYLHFYIRKNKLKIYLL